METILAALITGVLGSTLTLIIQEILKSRNLPKYPQERLNRLKGTWKSYFSQKVLDKEIEVEIIVSLKNKGKYIVGSATYKDEQKQKNYLVLYNGIFDGNILKIEYKNKEAYIFQRGTIIVKMDDAGNKLTGKFVGYSPQLGIIISGKVNSQEKLDIY